MGIPKLWKTIGPAAEDVSLLKMATEEGFNINVGSEGRGFRLGIDMSLWFFHASVRHEGENAAIQTIFYRLASLTKLPVLPLFVFDGKRRPLGKRGKSIVTNAHPFVKKSKEFIEAFGFEWHEAPGEAEAELSRLNQMGLLDGILTDDGDAFLFGAATVIRNGSPTLSGNSSHIGLEVMYRMTNITAKTGFMRDDLILMALLMGGDYDPVGLPGCGSKTAAGLVRYGFGTDLIRKVKSSPPEDTLARYLPKWRGRLRQELLIDSRGHIGRKNQA